MNDVLNRPAPAPDETLRYGPGPDHVAGVWWPRQGDPGTATTVMFLHGGFWRAAWDGTHTRPLAAALAGAGFTVCMPEFRRVGGGAGGGGGWPATFDDIAAAVDTLPARLSDRGGPPAPAGLVLAGHSAGGHLGLWAAARHRLPAGTPWHRPDLSPVKAVVALAAVSDLTACDAEGLGHGAARALMGGRSATCPERYARADPARLLPIGVPITLLHGSRDDRVPAAMSRGFADRARAAGDEVAWHELAGCDHFDVIDPLSAAWPAVLGAFGDAARS